MPSIFEIILTFAQIGLLSFGGGYASISLVQKQVVEIKHWMTYAEFADIVTIDELTPGPVAINAATFVGTKVGGTLGAIAATLGAVLPSCIIVLILIVLFNKYKKLKAIDGALYGLKSLVVALLLSTTISIASTALFYYLPIDIYAIDYISLIICIIAFALFRKTKINPIIILLGCGLVGLIVYPFI